ncbi:MAG: hypothetical protein AUH78_20995 [Gemmatimonadetes bacterium 13_1_40CM_4_69_8]|nr:MAG: hypothetical protein AUH78_20995 [Gemmatimonadetes bacterium 13_1_40CM_4_69_8]
MPGRGGARLPRGAREPVGPLRETRREPSQRGRRRCPDSRGIEQTAAREPQNPAVRFGDIPRHRAKRGHGRAVEPRPRDHLLSQARLARAGVAEDHSEHRRALGPGACPRLEQASHLRRAPAQRRTTGFGAHRRPRGRNAPRPLPSHTLGQGLRVGIRRGADFGAETADERFVASQRARPITAHGQGAHQPPNRGIRRRVQRECALGQLDCRPRVSPIEQLADAAL